MTKLTSKQRKILERYAQSLSPLVQIGKERFNEEQAAQISRLLDEHELVKVRYIIVKNLQADENSNDIKKELDSLIASHTSSFHVRTIGNVSIFYRASKVIEKRKFESELLKA